MNAAVIFYEYVIRSLESFDDYIIDGSYTYIHADCETEIFFELKSDNTIIIGYKGPHKKENMAAVLNRRHFSRDFFSELVIDTEHDKIYKRYLLKHDVADELKNMIETIFIRNSLSELKIEYTKE